MTLSAAPCGCAYPPFAPPPRSMGDMGAGGSGVAWRGSGGGTLRVDGGMFDRGGCGIDRGGGAPSPPCVCTAPRGGGTGRFDPPMPDPGRIGGGGRRDDGAPSPEPPDERICGGAGTGGVGAAMGALD